jgi:MarR family transcriptional regulator, temperature-dependent positive regulator of motility
VAGFDLTCAPGHLIRRAQQLHTLVWRELVGERLTSIQFAILVAVDAEPGIDQRTLAARVSLDTSTLAEVCGRMRERGLLARERDPRDARRHRLALTDAGAVTLRETAPLVEAVGRRLLEGFSGDDAGELMRLLSRLVGV